MLQAHDIDWIKQNRNEVTQGRTEVIDAQKIVQTGSDPITGEPINGAPQLVTFTVVWNEIKSLRDGEITLIGGREIQQGDVQVTFDAAADLNGVDYLIRGGRKYRLIAIDERGIGGKNRLEAVARAVI